MRTRLIVILLLLFAGTTTYAGDGDTPFKKGFSLEIGAGPGPLHMTLPGISPSSEIKRAWAKEGLEADLTDAFYPAVSLTGIWRTTERWEIALTGGVSWCHHHLIQYDSFGIDPYGEPRYDVSHGTPAGKADSSPVGSLTLQGRYLWRHQKTFEVYSAFGVGLTTATEFIPMPSLTPVAFRVGGKHLYAFAELTLSPFASIGHGGIGVKF